MTYPNLRRLYPLWALMCRAEPGIALDPPDSQLAEMLRMRDVDLRLYRRVIEIRDGYLALAPDLSPASSVHTRSDDGQHAALALLAEVANKREGRIVDAESRSKPAVFGLRDSARAGHPRAWGRPIHRDLLAPAQGQSQPGGARVTPPDDGNP